MTVKRNKEEEQDDDLVDHHRARTRRTRTKEGSRAGRCAPMPLCVGSRKLRTAMAMCSASADPEINEWRACVTFQLRIQLPIALQATLRDSLRRCGSDLVPLPKTLQDNSALVQRGMTSFITFVPVIGQSKSRSATSRKVKGSKKMESCLRPRRPDLRPQKSYRFSLGLGDHQLRADREECISDTREKPVKKMPPAQHQMNPTRRRGALCALKANAKDHKKASLLVWGVKA